MTAAHTPPMPGDELQAKKMPGHWLLARLGKRGTRPLWRTGFGSGAG